MVFRPVQNHILLNNPYPVVHHGTGNAPGVWWRGVYNLPRRELSQPVGMSGP